MDATGATKLISHSPVMTSFCRVVVGPEFHWHSMSRLSWLVFSKLTRKRRLPIFQWLKSESFQGGGRLTTESDTSLRCVRFCGGFQVTGV